jgi:hypothetical protein
MSALTVGIIGGTGPQGRGLAMRLALTRLHVKIGSRQADRAQEIAKELNTLMASAAPGVANDLTFTWIEGGANADVVKGSDIVMLTVPYENAEATLQDLHGSFRKGQIFVDVTVPLDFGKGDVQLITPPEGSGSKHLRTLVPAEVPLVGAGKTLPAQVLEALDVPMECSIFVYADDKDAKATVMEMFGRIPALKPLDVGGLSAAATVEGITMLLIRVNRKHKSHGGRIRVVGL